MTDTDLLFTPAVQAAALIRTKKLSPVEYLDAVLKAAEATGLPVRKVGLDADGVIRVDEIAAAVFEASAAGVKLLVAVHLVNNETGVISDLDGIAPTWPADRKSVV